MDRFTHLPFNKSYYVIHKPYNFALEKRYSFIHGVHKLWVFSNDKSFRPESPTKPRSELSVNGHVYSTSVWQFEADVFVPHGTSGVSLMQVFGGSPQATTLMIRVYDGSLYYYRSKVIFNHIYNKWFRLNVIHDVGNNNVKIYINGDLKFEGRGRGGTEHYFECGVYAQDEDSPCMESRWKNVNIYKKSN
ncbi:putative concanavalin A-like lectin/glucanase domain superfamily, alginate lyase 2 [Helianthus annuus]|nr:putative concanavalin A-like lectin/glucanase domain superfamily, alginate lyase 2 [Helianthus annuus]